MRAMVLQHNTTMTGGVAAHGVRWLLWEQDDDFQFVCLVAEERVRCL